MTLKERVLNRLQGKEVDMTPEWGVRPPMGWWIS